MREMGAHVGQSRHNLFLKWFAVWIDVVEDELVEAVLGVFIACKNIQELVSHPRLAV